MTDPQMDLDEALVSLTKALKETMFKNDRLLLNLIKSLIENVNRLEKEFAEYRHNQQYPPTDFNPIDFKIDRIWNMQPKDDISIDEFIKRWTDSLDDENNKGK